MRTGLIAWQRFWFAPVDSIAAAVFRLVFATGAFFFYLDRYLHFDLFYGERGLLPYEVLRKLTPEAYTLPFNLIAWVANESVVRGLHIGYLVALALLAIGWWPRALTWAICFAHVLLLNRNPMIQYGPDMVAGVWLLYLSLVDHSRELRLRFPLAQSFRVSPREEPVLSEAHAIGVRFFQLQLCVIYAYSGIEKLRGVTWWRGDALWNALAHGQMVTIDLGFLRHFTWVVIVLTYLTVAWEIYFPVLIWIRPLKAVTLLFGVALHLGIAVTMGIPYFSYFMIASYVFFIDPRTIRAWLVGMGSGFRREARA